MIDVFPDNFREVDYSNAFTAIRQLEMRIRYSEECIDFAVRGLARVVEGASGTSVIGVSTRLDAIEAVLASAISTLGNVRSAVSTISSDLEKTKIKTGIAPPTSSTEGAVGQLYIDRNANELYYCSGIAVGSTYVYTWTKLT